MRYLSVPKRVAVTLWSGGRGKMLIAIAFGWFLSISARMIYPALLPHLRITYGLTLTTAGLLLTVLWVAYGLGQLPGGMLADWVGERPLLILSSLSAAGMLTFVVIAESPAILFVATSLFGLGTALYGVSRFTILKEIYPDQLGTATGVTMGAGDFGNAVMPPTAGFIAGAIAWQYGFGLVIPLFLLAAVALWITLPVQSSTATSISETVSFGSILSTLRQSVVGYALVLLISWATIMQAFIGFYPTYLIDVKGLPPHIATGLFGLFFALGSFIKPLSGRAYDRVGVRIPLLVIMGLTAIGLVALPLSTDLWAFVVVTVLASSVLGFETIVISDVTGKLPKDTQGTGLGSLRTLYIMLGALSPVLFGAVADQGYFNEGFVGLAVLAGLVIVFVISQIEY